VLRSSDEDAVTLVGAGVTVHHCLEAADRLAGEGIHCRVIDLYSIKPVDARTIGEASAVTDGRIVIVEDHYPEGGVAGAVLEALAAEPHPRHVVHLAVRRLPGSGSPAETMAAAGIDADAIVAAARSLAGEAH